MTQVECAAPPRETFQALLLGLSRDSIFPPAARCYICRRSLPAVSGTRAPIERSLPVEPSLFEQEKAVPAPVRTCRVSRPDRRNRVRFPVDSVTVQRPARSLCRAEVLRGKIEARDHAIPFRFGTS